MFLVYTVVAHSILCQVKLSSDITHTLIRIYTYYTALDTVSVSKRMPCILVLNTVILLLEYFDLSNKYWEGLPQCYWLAYTPVHIAILLYLVLCKPI